MSSSKQDHLDKPELWAGLECTVNRVGDHYFDQMNWNGHGWRVADLDLFATLAVKAIRYPILWERIAPEGVAKADWHWADERLSRLRELGIRPIVGLVHHGSGPRYTELLDPSFPEKLAEYAHAVAARYPWVDAYTPVNEPLTTARFSGLYGKWYPHASDGLSFSRMLLNECRATQLAMRAIRDVNSSAQLIQTEDLGKVFSTPLLAYQADFENERRWLSLDLLCGRVKPGHPLWDYLRWVGLKEEELASLLEACPPDVIGINYYVTSERYLDERLERYPPTTYGGNGHHQYADVEAVRVVEEGILGVGPMLRDTWERYKLPVAISEVHLGATREEQLRWLVEEWDAANAIRREGVDLRAVTVWSLLGTYNWNTLLTRDDDHYEPGVFDVRSIPPRPTALAKALKYFTAGKPNTHPVLASPGWWRKSSRLLYPPVSRDNTTSPTTPSTPTPTSALVPRPQEIARPVLITGATGTLGRAFERLCRMRNLPFVLLPRQAMDITDAVSVTRAIEQHRPWAIINAAGYVRVDDAERDSQTCRRVNTLGPALLASACADYELPLMTFSSDLVFDGNRSKPYIESNDTAPLSVYGASKADAEFEVLQRLPTALIVRTSAFFGPWDRYNFLYQVLQSLSEGRDVVAADDAVVSPTYVPDLVNASLDLLIDGEHGIWHVANQGETTWADFARHGARVAGLEAQHVHGQPLDKMGYVAPRPAYCALGSERGLVLPPLGRAVERYWSERDMT